MIPIRITKRSRNKYSNKWTDYRGMRFQSAREASYALMLDLRVRAHDIKSWQRQVKFPLRVNGTLIAHYVIDFEITNNDGSLEYVEVKGFWTPDAILKWKLFGALYPHLKRSVEK